MTSEADGDRVPAEMLDGVDLGNGWSVVGRQEMADDATGSTFSVGYIVEHEDGRQGFLKAMDYVSRLQHAADPAEELQAMTAAYLFERDILRKCRDLSRVITALEEGEYQVPNHALGRVQYLIFERADGDVRRYLDTARQFDLSWVLRTLHHVAVGLFQMHREGMVHQDVKPSNVLTFDAGESSKVGDLGRSSRQGYEGPFDGNRIAGDPQYAPPELLYGSVPKEWGARRIGCDVYHLGSMAVFMFARMAMTPMLMEKLAPDLRWNAWGGAPYEEVLPHLRAALEDCMEDLRETMTNPYCDDIVEIVRRLCDPDPQLRGHPKYRAKDGVLALERYVARFDLLARRAEYALKKSL